MTAGVEIKLVCHCGCKTFTVKMVPSWIVLSCAAYRKETRYEFQRTIDTCPRCGARRDASGRLAHEIDCVHPSGELPPPVY